jgi:hypothetical protein
VAFNGIGGEFKVLSVIAGNVMVWAMAVGGGAGLTTNTLLTGVAALYSASPAFVAVIEQLPVVSSVTVATKYPVPSGVDAETVQTEVLLEVNFVTPPESAEALITGLAPSVCGGMVGKLIVLGSFVASAVWGNKVASNNASKLLVPEARSIQMLCKAVGISRRKRLMYEFCGLLRSFLMNISHLLSKYRLCNTTRLLFPKSNSGDVIGANHRGNVVIFLTTK